MGCVVKGVFVTNDTVGMVCVCGGGWVLRWDSPHTTIEC